MGDEMVNNHSKMVKVIEQCQIAPPPSSPPPTTVPLSYLDLHWFDCNPMNRIFFYEFPHTTHNFLQNQLPILKHSLSLTLQHFFPFSANVVLPPKPQTPHILYSDGDSVSFTVAESAADFTRIVSDSPTDVRDAYPFVPTLPSPSTLKDGTLLIPTMAIQVTVFPNQGFAICANFRHVVADGRSFHHFMKSWASNCSSTEAASVPCVPLPLHTRCMIEDPKGLNPVFLEQLWNFPPMENPAKPLHEDAPPSNGDGDITVRHRFVLSHQQLEKLKKWVAVKGRGTGLETLHLSTFAVTCSLFWVCKVISESEETTPETVIDGHDYRVFTFLVDWRDRTELAIPIPATYFGNCLTNCVAAVSKKKLVGENGVCEAVNAIGSQVWGLKGGEPLKGIEYFKSARSSKESGEWSKRLFHVGGSLKLNAYETDFGWGKPKLSEQLRADDFRSMYLSHSRHQNGGVEVGLVLKGIKLKKFSVIFEQQLRDIEGS